MNARFYAPSAEKSGDVIELREDEAEHLTRVLRLRTGAEIRVFDGRGHEFDAVVERAAKSAVHVRVGHARQPASREPGVAITLALAVLKQDNMDDAVRDAAMMGVAAIQPVVSARSETTLASLQRGKRVDRWHRIAVSSAKQCGRATVPAVLEPRPFDALPAALAQLGLPGPGLMFVEPGSGLETIGLHDLEAAPPREATIVVGPEGGWALTEIEQASAACRLITLDAPTIRAAAMPLVALTALFTLWRKL